MDIVNYKLDESEMNINANFESLRKIKIYDVYYSNKMFERALYGDAFFDDDDDNNIVLIDIKGNGNFIVFTHQFRSDYDIESCKIKDLTYLGSYIDGNAKYKTIKKDDYINGSF